MSTRRSEVAENALGVAVDRAMTYPPGATSSEIAEEANKLTRTGETITADGVDITIAISSLGFWKDSQGRWCLSPPAPSSC